MSQHTHTTCDGCGEEMELHEYGQMLGTIGLSGHVDIKHFHSPLCLARYAEKENKTLYDDQPQFHIVVETGVTDGHP